MVETRAAAEKTPAAGQIPFREKIAWHKASAVIQASDPELKPDFESAWKEIFEEDMNVKVKILVENTVPAPGLIGEHGFSALVTAGPHRILFDTGSAGALIANANRLGVGLTSLDALVISHGHFDHTGAVLQVVELNPGLQVYAHTGIFSQHLADRGNGQTLTIGMPFTLADLEASGGRFQGTDTFSVLFPGICVTGEIPRCTDYEDAGPGFRTERDGQIIGDQIMDDMAMVIKTEDGLVVISGCAHAGLINTLEYCMEETGVRRIRAFIGGTHLMAASVERISRTAEALQTMDIETLAVAHCTGFNAAAILKQALGNKLVKAETAMVFNYE